MAKKLTELVTPTIIGAYYTERKKELPPYLLEAWFPRRKQLGLELSWLKGANRAPISLTPSAFDAKVIPRSFGKVEKQTTEMPFFKNSYPIDETDRQHLNTLLQAFQSENNPQVKLLLDKILDRASAGIEDAELTPEILRASLLTTGTITISGNGVSFVYDYNLGALNKGTFDWSNKSTADPINDINEKKEAIASNTGVTPGAILINTATFKKLKKIEYIENAFIVASGLKRSINTKDLIDYIESETQMSVYLYDNTYTNNSGDVVNLIPDNSIVLLPEAPVGSTYYGTTPEESDLMTGNNEAEVKIVNTGVAVTTYKEKDPVKDVIKVSEIVLPSGEGLGNIFCGTINFGA